MNLAWLQKYVYGRIINLRNLLSQSQMAGAESLKDARSNKPICTYIMQNNGRTK